MSREFPLEILCYIFQFLSNCWFLSKNGKRLINIEALQKIPRPIRIHASKLVFTVILRISTNKFYYLDFWTIAECAKFTVTICENYHIKQLTTSSNHVDWEIIKRI